MTNTEPGWTDQLLDVQTVEAVDPTRPVPITDGDGTEVALAITHPDNWTTQVVDLAPWQQRPYRAVGRRDLHTPESLVDYITEQPAAPTIYIDADRRSVTAVFDDHDGDGPGWREHRATLTIRHTEDWDGLTAINKQWLTSDDIADWLDDHGHLVTEPGAADMIELVRDFRATTTTEFARAENDINGDVKLTFRTDTEASSSVTIPTQVVLEVEVVRGADPVAIPGRFRYRVQHGAVTFGLLFPGLDRIVRGHFDASAEIVKAAGVGLCLRGSAG